MKAYRFRLDSVLRVRQLQERVAAHQLAVAVRALHAGTVRAGPGTRALDGLDAPAGRLTVGAVRVGPRAVRPDVREARPKAEEVEAAER